MKKKKIAIVAAVFVAAVIAVNVWKRYSKNADPDRIRVSGNIELTEVDIAFKIPGRLVERTVDEGDAVRKGQLIARIDRETLERQRARELAGALAAETQLPQLRTAILFQREAILQEAALRRAEIAAAEAQLAKLVAGSRPQEIQYAKAAVADAQSQFAQAKADWERAQQLIKTDDITRMQYDQYQARYRSAEAALKRAEENLALVVEGPRKEDIEAARAQLERARAALRYNEAQNIDLKRREQEIETRRAEIERARAQLRMAEAQLADTVAYSPVDGVVLVKSADPGEVLAAGATVLKIGDLDRPWLRAYIREQDLGRVKLGMPATVTTDSYPGKQYPGKVSFISSEAEFTPKHIQTTEERVKLVYRIKIALENPHHELKANMPVDAVIQLNR
jgi:HlyD family secretion protein